MQEGRDINQVIAEQAFTVQRQAHCWVGGKALAGSAGSLPLVYPGTGETFAELDCASADEAGLAVAAAREVFDAGRWSRMPAAGRQAILRHAACLIEAHSEELALLETLCAGLPLRHLRARQLPRAAENFRFFADYIGLMAGETFEQQDGYLTTVTRQPAGVAALLSPWNAPLALASMQVASCIAFGNSCVLKPSEHTPLAILRMVQLLEQAGLPAGVVNVVNGPGSGAGQALVAHAGVDRIAFTGGTETARAIMATAAANLTPVHFELGGKSANMVFDDADFERAVDGSLLNVFSNNGQICIAGSRILVQRGIAERFIEAFVQRARQLRVGCPLAPATEAGPLAFEQHMQRVLGYAQLAVEEGAELLCGGQRDARFQRGWYIEPTVVRVSSNALRICQQEVFGPFASIQVFDSTDEALAIANDSRFGLVAYAWTSKLERVMRLQQEIQAGTLWVNTPLLRDLRAPFGGFKQSGIGRDGPRQCAEFYCEEKATIVPRRAVAIPRIGLADATTD
jgi:5-carboxymethyl-2-hydroxymuconic-semialdehyde dehydrogenase/aminomuconate-semialdehyde/2-hydroxymuconate-6-semialdehyde dehydrogenase